MTRVCGLRDISCSDTNLMQDIKKYALGLRAWEDSYSALTELA